LICLKDNGFSKLRTISEDKVYGFQELDITFEKLISRVDYLCAFFKSASDESSLKKRKAKKSKSKGSKKKKKDKVQRDAEGNIIFPIQVSTSLKLLSHGKKTHPFNP